MKDEWGEFEPISAEMHRDDRTMVDLWQEAREAELRYLDRIAALQRAVDTACNALEASAYVGGPTEREAWQSALAALQEVKTQHKGTEAKA